MNCNMAIVKVATVKQTHILTQNKGFQFAYGRYKSHSRRTHARTHTRTVVWIEGRAIHSIEMEIAIHFQCHL